MKTRLHLLKNLPPLLTRDTWPSHPCCSVVFITWQDFGKQLEVLARLPQQKSALRASQVTYLHCAKLQPLNTLQVQNVLQI